MSAEELDPSVAHMARSLKREVHYEVPNNVSIVRTEAVINLLKRNPWMVPTEDGRLYIAKYDSDTFNRMKNLVNSHLKMELCAPSVVRRLLEIASNDEGDNKRGHDNEMVQIFRLCLKEKVTDLHIVARKSNVRFMRRIDGDLYPLATPKAYQLEDIHRICSSAVNYVTHESGGQSKNNFNALEPQDASFTLPVDGKKIEIRYAHVPENEGIDVVLRVLASSNAGRVDISTLGYPDDQLRLFYQVNRMPNGIILCCGETGAGKTTLLAGMLSLQPSTKKIYSYEDPVEIKLHNVTQVPVNTSSSLMSWEPLSQNALRMDPDIIQFGEIRSAVLAEESIKAASTGHLVYSTLHTNDAPGAIQRLVDLGIDRKKLAMPNILRLIIAQKLIPLLCPNCSIEAHELSADPAEVQRLKGYFGRHFDQVRFKGRGCKHCSDRGFDGRLVVAEAIYVDDRGREFIRKGDIPGWIEYIRGKGWKSMEDRAVSVIIQGNFDPLVVEEKLGSHFGVDLYSYEYETLGARELMDDTKCPV